MKNINEFKEKLKKLMKKHEVIIKTRGGKYVFSDPIFDIELEELV